MSFELYAYIIGDFLSFIALILMGNCTKQLRQEEKKTFPAECKVKLFEFFDINQLSLCTA